MHRGAMLDKLRQRWRRAGFPDYPSWIPLLMDGSAAAAAVVCIAQRATVHPLLPVTALVLLALSPWVVGFAGVKLPWPVFAALAVGGSASVMALFPVEYDFALFILVLMAGHLGATASLAGSAAATVLAGGLLVVLDRAGQFNGSKFSLAALVIGWDVGFILKYQQRRLEEQARTQAARESQVALEERQRIAREVHDVIAHSLSVTMLHVTAVRRDLEQDGAVDVTEAVDALRDAERIGRQAMADIRRTVGLLGNGSTSATTPAPDLRQVPALVDEFRAAGLEVDFEQEHVPDGVPVGVGLGVYRILQESLANVAKHQPRAGVRVELGTLADAIRLTVENDVAAGVPVAHDASGSGLNGMRHRAELLGGRFSAGEVDGRWLVHAEIPLADSPRGDPEPMKCSGLAPLLRRAEGNA